MTNAIHTTYDVDAYNADPHGSIEAASRKAALQMRLGALKEAGIPIPDRDDFTYYAGAGCYMRDPEAWENEVAELYDDLT